MGKHILIVGGGGREHALARCLDERSTVERITCAPGNAGTSGLSSCHNIALSKTADIVEWAKQNHPDLVLVGPEIPLAQGIADELQDAGIKVFGPALKSAQLESSKAFAKEFMERHGVATAASRRFDSSDKARQECGCFGYPVVVKADGLAAGKGVIICANEKEAHQAIDEVMVERRFGDAGSVVVLEECLVGWETSLIAVVDSTGHHMAFPYAQDHKRAGEGDLGLNTGGMGVIAPHPLVTQAVAKDIEQNILQPTLKGLVADGLAYPGFLFIGVMVTSQGAKTLEYNVRFGDPEAQALLPLFDGDFLSLLEASLEGTLSQIQPQWTGGASCCVVLASEGYPEKSAPSRPLSGIQNAEKTGAWVYGAGLGRNEKNELVSQGGRVLGVTGIAENLEAAREKAYEGIKQIDLEGGWFRRDIGVASLHNASR
ncbi:MAG: phosphoribosylamine--glycine ligase [Spirochaetales bacterium]|nr:phosphoribosylamine--glycine ligase [Spirochaetales bacterium]